MKKYSRTVKKNLKTVKTLRDPNRNLMRKWMKRKMTSSVSLRKMTNSVNLKVKR